jgi:hypothetical protein
MKQDEKPACSTCRFYQAYYDESEYGHCRRHPPRIADDDGVGLHPEVSGVGWCGEYRKGGRTERKENSEHEMYD